MRVAMKSEEKMREIEFRAKGQTSGRWYYGLLAFLKDEVCRIYINATYTYICDSDTIGQYTGKKDIIETKIYEGDIVEYSVINFINNKIEFFQAQVVYCEGAFVLDNGREVEYLGECEIEEMGIKVVGNIYDNPELLQEG